MAKYRRKKGVELWVPFRDIDFKVITAKAFYTDNKSPNNFNWPDGVLRIGKYDDLRKYIDSDYVFIAKYGSEWKISKIKPGDYVATSIPAEGILGAQFPRQEVITGEDLDRYYDCIECDCQIKTTKYCRECIHMEVCAYLTSPKANVCGYYKKG